MVSFIQTALTSKAFILMPLVKIFGSGEAKGVINETVRGHDIFIISDVFNYGVTYKMCMEVPMALMSSRT